MMILLIHLNLYATTLVPYDADEVVACTTDHENDVLESWVVWKL